MTTPFMRHRAKVLAKQAQETALKGGAQAGYGQGPSQQKEILLTALAEDQRALSMIQSKEGKAAHKAAHINKYMPWVDGLLEASQAVQSATEGQQSITCPPDEIMATMLVWSYDVGNYRRMLDIATHMIKHGMPMPEQFSQGVESFTVKGISEDALAGLMSDEQANTLLEEVALLIEGADIHEKRLALFYKARGHTLIHRLGNAPFDDEKLDLEAASTAYVFLNYALDLDTGSGVKKDIERLTSFIKKINPERLEQLLQRVQLRRQGQACPAPEGACVQGEDLRETQESTPIENASTPSLSHHEGDQNDLGVQQ